MVVAIDGPAGTGKSSVSQMVARSAGFFHLNSGKFYRAITWKAQELQCELSDEESVLAVARNISIVLEGDAFLLDGHLRDEELHTPRVDQAVAPVSAFPSVRQEVNLRLKEIAGTRDLVVEGRDMSTVVFPDAEVKVFLDADPAERARRRYEQNGRQGDLEELEKAIRERDAIDRAKETGRLAQAPDAVYLDTTHLTLRQVCDRVVAIIYDKTNHGRSN
ncbi:cytidylate kinase [Alkalispirochaeta americana]|uniref:Cytidylate kinase n=1 Tax=Alkalispirochaeta americana TaxID=159291 RepID=A0A1N6P6R5_9SPIO|nr:(d)CMP kinase [Alkalispirochaeta americana]SIQ00071.1 cytidylate kinase [Alkalispirochaeta americana]